MFYRIFMLTNNSVSVYS